jgi:transposase
MEAYPVRLRKRIIELYEQGKQTHEIAQMLGTCRSGTRRIRQVLRERNTLEPLRPQTGPRSGLSDERAAQLSQLVAADPDATREELRQRLNVSADVRTIGRWLAKLGLVLKKSRCTPQSRTGRTWPSDAGIGTSS